MKNRVSLPKVLDDTLFVENFCTLMSLDQIDVSYEEELPSGGADMSFFEHLEQLRWHIIRSVIAIVIFGIVAFVFRSYVFSYVIMAPIEQDFYSYRILCYLSEVVGLGERLCFTPQMPEFDVQLLNIGDKFIIPLKISFILGFILSFPYIFWELWRFVSPALHTNESKYSRGIVFVCSSLFLVGVVFGYFVIAPFAFDFLASFDSGMEDSNTKYQPTIDGYLNYLIMFTVPAGVLFELPVLVYILSKLDIVTPAFLKKYRRHAFVLILVVGAIVTPPDIITQFFIGIPVYFLYELSIIVSSRVHRNRKLEEE